MKLTTLIQYILPQHALSRLLGRLLNSRNPRIKNTLIRMFIAHFKVNTDEMLEPQLEAYGSFNEFFIRVLKKEARPVTSKAHAIASPADGTIAQIGIAKQGELIQAKGHFFTVQNLLGGDTALAKPFLNGHYTTIYLGPKDYHRIHMPVDGTLKQMIFVPGKLFSVNANTVNDVNNIFARNERVICLFDTDHGPMAVILVGAIVVASISVAWQGLIAPSTQTQTTTWSYDNQNIVLKRGDELGYFMTGSTVILLFADGQITWDENLLNNTSIKFGEAMGVQN
jgi:phosphatidylserine decarboxylase